MIGDKRALKIVVNSNTAKAKMVKQDKCNNNKPKPGSKMGPKRGISKKHKFQEKCYNCGKAGHKSTDYRLQKITTEKKGQTRLMLCIISQGYI